MTAPNEKGSDAWRWWVERCIALIAAGGSIVALAKYFGGDTPPTAAATTVATMPATAAPPEPKVNAAVTPTPAAIPACPTLFVTSPSDARGRPVRKALGSTVPVACHVKAQVNLVCREGETGVCVEGRDSQSNERCIGYAHTDGFVNDGVLPTQLSDAPRCDNACPPASACSLVATK